MRPPFCAGTSSLPAMTSIQQLIREAHRRSLWQVLGVFLAASWGVLQVVETVTESIGLPDWTPGMAFVLLLLGLPVVLATAFVQEGVQSAADADARASADGGTEGEARGDEAAAPVNLAAGTGSLDRPSRRPSRAARLFTWKHAVLGGVGAFALLGFSLVAYFVMWTTGVGPVGNLNAQGVFDDGETVVLADFENRSADPGLGGVVTEALRVDLASSSAISLLAAPRIAELLSLMQADPSDGLSAETARELAIRGGVKAVIEGDVGSAGTGYIFTAVIRASESGEILATARRSADSAEGVIAAIDGLSQDIRERAGESLSSIKSGEGLEQVTTTSLEALRLYAEASALGELGEDEDAKARLEQALELDPEFAMAWRELAIALQGAEAEPGELEEAATRAYELRDRLTPRERGYTIALYHNNITGDQDASRRAYADLLEDYPDDAIALNNISITYAVRGQFEEAAEFLNRAVQGPGRTGTALFNLAYYLSAMGRAELARGYVDEMFAEYPGRSPWNLTIGSWIELLLGNQEQGLAMATELETMASTSSRWRNNGTALHFVAAGLRGDWTAGEERAVDALERLSRSDDADEYALLAARVAGWKIVAQADTAGSRDLLEAVIAESFPRLPAPARPYGSLRRTVRDARRSGSGGGAPGRVGRGGRAGRGAGRRRAPPHHRRSRSRRPRAANRRPAQVPVDDRMCSLLRVDTIRAPRGGGSLSGSCRSGRDRPRRTSEHRTVADVAPDDLRRRRAAGPPLRGDGRPGSCGRGVSHVCRKLHRTGRSCRGRGPGWPWNEQRRSSRTSRSWSA